MTSYLQCPICVVLNSIFTCLIPHKEHIACVLEVWHVTLFLQTVKDGLILEYYTSKYNVDVRIIITVECNF